jgi:integrase
MRRINMTVFRPSRRRTAGYVAKWRDPTSGKWRQKTLHARIGRDAGAEAAVLAEQIASGLSPNGPSWPEFCTLYEGRHLCKRSPKSLQSWRTTTGCVTDLAPLRNLSDATPAWVLKFQTALAARGLAVNTVATYSARLRAALRWGERQRLLDRAPYVAVESESAARSRAVTLEEVERMIMASAKVRPADHGRWERLLRGQWESGFRIGEMLLLSWDAEAAIRVVTSGKYPLIHFGRKKNKKRQWYAVSRPLWAILCESRESDRHGPVFPVPGRGGCQMATKGVVRVIAAIGDRAGVVTDTERGKTATSHDIRRGYVVRMLGDGTLSPPLLQRQTRHARQETMLDYYDTRGAEEVAEKLWEVSNPPQERTK